MSNEVSPSGDEREGKKMRTGNYELVVVWHGGDASVYEYATEEEARDGGESMKMALGNQVCWWGVRPQMVK